MAANFWRLLFALALALSTASGIALAAALCWPWWTAPALALVLLFGIPAALVAGSLMLAGPGAAGRWRVLPGETAAFTLAIIAMCGTSRRQRPGAQLAATRASRPVLLLHGLLCNQRVWRALQVRLAAAGFGPVEALDIGPLRADIETLAAGVAPRLLALQRRCNGERVAIVAHSMGGLIARVLMRDLGRQAIRRIVTLATPHHGTILARILPWPNARQMTRASAWLQSLNASQEGRLAVPLASIYSIDDNLVAPAGSARLQGAELHERRGLGHFGMLGSRDVQDLVIATLSQESAA
jgi:triacylglycerol esterase/lipase EstA (alpha/beta hydrolase family)